MSASARKRDVVTQKANAFFKAHNGVRYADLDTVASKTHNQYADNLIYNASLFTVNQTSRASHAAISAAKWGLPRMASLASKTAVLGWAATKATGQFFSNHPKAILPCALAGVLGMGFISNLFNNSAPETFVNAPVKAATHVSIADSQSYQFKRDNGQIVYLDENGIGRDGTLGKPVNRAVRTSGYGWRHGRRHQGVDLAAPAGTPILAAASGTVRRASWYGGYGNYIKLQHDDPSLATAYGHLSRYNVRAGQHVNKGDVIGYVGSTGRSTGPHLHFEVLKNGKRIDPDTFRGTAPIRLEGAELARFKKEIEKQGMNGTALAFSSP